MSHSHTRIAKDNLRLVYSIASQISRLIGHTIEIDELASYGTIGLLQALKRFDPERGVQWSSFASHRIRGAIWDGVRQLCPVSRRQIEKRDAGEPCALVRAVPFQDQLADQAPGADELCDELQLRRRLAEALRRLPEIDLKVLQAHYGEEQSLLDLAARRGHTKSWASRKHTDAVVRLRAELAPVMAAA